MAFTAEPDCPWCAGEGLDPMTGEQCRGCKSSGACGSEVGSEASAGRRRSRQAAATSGAKVNLRGFVAEAATLQSKPLRRRPARLQAVVEEEGAGSLSPVRGRRTPALFDSNTSEESGDDGNGLGNETRPGYGVHVDAHGAIPH